jgi:hypothetical protein
LRTTATTARTTGEDNDNSKDNDSKDDNNSEDNSNVGKDDNNDGSNNDSGGGGGGGGNIGGQVIRVARSVAWLVAPLVAWHLHTVGITQIHLGINLFRSKFYSGCPDIPHKFYFILYLDRI